MFVSFNRHTTEVTSGAETAHSFRASPIFSGVRVAQALVFYVVSC